MMLLKKEKGFTLIELLVVISIIGMLSSVVLASLSTAREKGRVSAGLIFATHMFQAYATDAFGAWNFDTLSLGSVPDISPNNEKRNLDPYDVNVITLADETPRSTGKSLSIAANRSFPRTGLYDTGEVQKVTVGAWVYVNSANLNGTGHVMYAVDANQRNGYTPLGMWISNGTVHCYQESHSVYTDLTFTGVSPRKWHYLACSVNAQTDKIAGYLDGRVVAQDDLNDSTPVLKPGAVSVGGWLVAVSGACSGCGTMNMYIDDAAAFIESPLD